MKCHIFAVLMTPIIAIFCPVLSSSSIFLNTGTSNKMKVLSSSVCSLFSFRISNNCCSWFTLCKNYFCTLGVSTCGISIYVCAAICISFTLFVFITVFFLIAASHWCIFKKVKWTCVLGSRNNIWPAVPLYKAVQTSSCFANEVPTRSSVSCSSTFTELLS